MSVYIYRFDHTIERRFNKFTDLPFPPYDHSKDTGHHTSDRYNRVFIPKIIGNAVSIFECQKSGKVDSHQIIFLRTEIGRR